MKTPWMTSSALLLALAGCGGAIEVAPVASTDLPPPMASQSAVAAPADAAPQGAPRVLLQPRPPAAPPVLVYGDGQPAPAGAPEPADAGARTRAGRYATPAQAAALEAALGNRAIRVDVGCCDATEADMAVMMAFVSQAAHDLSNAAPVLVHGSDARMVATVADRLGDAGLGRVWAVTR